MFTASPSSQKYADEWEAEKAVYAEQMKVYHNSPAYKAFLEAKHQQEIYLEAKQQAELAAKRQQQVMSSGQVCWCTLVWCGAV